MIRRGASPIVACFPLSHGDGGRLAASIEQAVRNAVTNPGFLIFTDGAAPAILKLKARHAGLIIVKKAASASLCDLIRSIPAAFARHDIVICRPGVMLPKAWDARLSFAAHADDDIATVSPIMETHPFFSILPEEAGNIRDEEADNLALAFGSRLNHEIPVFSEECVYMRRTALNAIRLELNGKDAGSAAWRLSEAFRRRGFHNVICDHVFTGGRTSTIKPTPWPSGSMPVGPTHPLAFLRIAVKEAVTAGFNAPAPDLRPCQLHVAHSWGGGLDKWVMDYARADGKRKNIILKSGGMIGEYGQKLELYESPGGEKPARMWLLPYPIRATALRNLDYKRVLDEIIRDYGVGVVFVSSLIGHSLDVLRTGLPTIHVMHDYHPFCPALNVHFGSLCESCAPGRLAKCFAENPLNAHFKNMRPDEWRDIRKGYLNAVIKEGIILAAPSESVRRNLLALAPALRKNRFHIIPHGSDFAVTDKITPPEDGRPRIVIPGRMAPQKGLGILTEIVDELTKTADLRLAGCGAGGKAFEGKPGVTVIAEYDHDGLPDLMRRISPHFALLMSTVPETFSYTLSELNAMGVPALASRIGSFTDRIREGVTGFLCAPEPEAFLGKIRALRSQPAKLERVRKNLRSLRSRTLSEMVGDYHKLAPLPPFMEKRYASPARLSLAGEKIRKTAAKKMTAQTATVDARIFHWNWKAGAGELGFSPRRVLFFRSARDWSLELAVKDSAESWKCELALLCQKDHAERYAGKFPSVRIMAADDPGFLNLRTMGAEALSSIRAWRADMAVIVTSGAVYDGYENIVEIAKACGVRRVYFVNAAGEFKKA